MTMSITESRQHLAQVNGEGSISGHKVNFSRRTKLEKSLIIFNGIILVIVIILAVILGTYVKYYNDAAAKLENKTIGPISEEYCVSPECVDAASHILNAIDRTVDPCKDFFQFACGTWNKENPIPDTKSSWGNFGKLRDELQGNIRDILEANNTDSDPKSLKHGRTYYRACMDEAKMEERGIQPMLDILESLNIPKSPPTRKTVSEFDWVDRAARVQELLGEDLLIAIYVDYDEKNTSRNIVHIDRPDLGLTRRYYVEDKYSEVMSSYKKYVKDLIEFTLQKLSENSTSISNSTTDHGDMNYTKEAENFATLIIEFETKLAKIMAPEEERRDVENLYHLMNVNNLTDITDGGNASLGNFTKVNWGNYMKKLFRNTNVTLDLASLEIILVDINYYRNLSSVLNSSEPSTIALYFWYRVVDHLATATLKMYRDLAFQLKQALYGTKLNKPRWKVCSTIVNNKLGMAISNYYVQEHFSKDLKKQINVLVQDLRQAFKSQVNQLSWMDKETKKVTVEKADAIKEFIAYPEWILQPKKLDEYYYWVEVEEGKYMESIIKLTKNYVKKELEKLPLPTDKHKWESDPTVVNAFYYSSANSITFPAGILQPPFFGLGVQYLNYGAVGSVIGHEITHGFDDEGRQYDKDGNARQWWTNHTLQNYEDRAKCFIKQYGDFKIDNLDGNYSINGINTQGENIADNGGIRESIKAYQLFVGRNGPEPKLPGLESFTHEQLFFLAFAHVWCGTERKEYLRDQLVTDAHSPVKYRVLGTLSNSPEFSKVWNCKKDSRMNPEKKCQLW